MFGGEAVLSVDEKNAQSEKSRLGSTGSRTTVKRLCTNLSTDLRRPCVEPLNQPRRASGLQAELSPVRALAVNTLIAELERASGFFL